MLVDMASRTKLPFRVFTLDTGRLHAADVPVPRRGPRPLRREHRGGHARSPRRCRSSSPRRGSSRSTRTATRSAAASARSSRCVARSRDLRAYVTGQRKDQSPGTRADIPVVQIDTAFSTPEAELVKFNPLANWSARARSGSTSASTRSPTTPSTTSASAPSAASPARARPTPASTSARAAGGGKKPRSASAGCTSSTSATPSRGASVSRRASAPKRLAVERRP